MLNRDYEGQNCSIARALEVVGERWTLLIIRDVLLGLRRFDELQESLGIARNVLTDRLNRLVDEGVLERVLYSERPERYEYQLTKKGLDLQHRADRASPVGRRLPERKAAAPTSPQGRQEAGRRRDRAEGNQDAPRRRGRDGPRARRNDAVAPERRQ